MDQFLVSEGECLGITKAKTKVKILGQPNDVVVLVAGEIIKILKLVSLGGCYIKLYTIDNRNLQLSDITYSCDHNAIKIIDESLCSMLITIGNRKKRLLICNNNEYVKCLRNLQLHDLVNVNKTYLNIDENAVCIVKYIGAVPQIGPGTYVGVMLYDRTQSLNGKQKQYLARKYFACNDNNGCILNFGCFFTLTRMLDQNHDNLMKIVTEIDRNIFNATLKNVSEPSTKPRNDVITNENRRPAPAEATRKMAPKNNANKSEIEITDDEIFSKLYDNWKHRAESKPTNSGSINSSETKLRDVVPNKTSISIEKDDEIERLLRDLNDIKLPSTSVSSQPMNINNSSDVKVIKPPVPLRINKIEHKPITAHGPSNFQSPENTTNRFSTKMDPLNAPKIATTYAASPQSNTRNVPTSGINVAGSSSYMKEMASTMTPQRPNTSVSYQNTITDRTFNTPVAVPINKSERERITISIGPSNFQSPNWNQTNSNVATPPAYTSNWLTNKMDPIQVAKMTSMYATQQSNNRNVPTHSQSNLLPNYQSPNWIAVDRNVLINNEMRTKKKNKNCSIM